MPPRVQRQRAIDPNDVRRVLNFEQLLTFLAEKLDWPYEEANLDVLTFDESPGDLGLDAATPLPTEIRQLRLPKGTQCPWGIFFITFDHSRLPAMTLRRLLRAVVKKRCASANTAERARWDRTDLLFACSHGTASDRGITFVHFAAPRVAGSQPRLASFGWSQTSFNRTLAEFNLPHLRWLDDNQTADAWRAALKQAFDKEALTRKFYRTLEDLYLNTIVPDLNRSLRDEERAKQAALLLINRLLFLYFVQRKGWLGGDLGYLAAKFGNHRERPTHQSFYLEFLWPLFNALCLRKEDRTDFQEVPFLNGGLFEPQGVIADSNLSIRNDSFAKLFDQLLEPFNFTVTEDTPLDIDVAVDPEMLGKVFEQLITNREKTGAYYTPRVVVSFMCREALKGYLGGHASLVDEHKNDDITVAKARELLAKLDQVKIIDPACGSGAYLVGMLHELDDLNRLLDTRAHQATARDEYDRKLAIIEKNLYGVDVDPAAVNIARLRLWLSLVVESNLPEPPPLPNLDFKIELGDSLTAPDPGETAQTDLLRDDLIHQFAEAKALYQSTAYLGDKPAMKSRVADLREQIAVSVHGGSLARGFDWAVEFAEVFNRPGAQGFDIVIANPPYGASVDDDVRDLYFDRRTEGAQSKDTYGLFIARGLQLLHTGGSFTYIVSDTWRTLRTFKPLRHRLLHHAIVSHVVDLPAWIFGATVTTSILTLKKALPPANSKLIAADLRPLPAGDWVRLDENLRAIAAHGPDLQTTEYARYTYAQSLIASWGGESFFIGSPSLYAALNRPGTTPLSRLADVKVGLQTGDNDFYLSKRATARGSYRTVDEARILTTAELGALTSDEKLNGLDPSNWGDRTIVPYDKGGASDADDGWMPNYWVPTEYFIDWSRANVDRLKTGTLATIKRGQGRAADIRPGDDQRIASRFQNVAYYFRPGITFSSRGVYAPTFRMTGGGPFDKESSALFLTAADGGQPHPLLGYLASRFARYAFKNFIQHTVSNDQGALENLPIPVLNSPEFLRIGELAAQIIQRQAQDPRYPYHLHEQLEIDALVYRAFALTPDDIREVELWFCRRYPAAFTTALGLLQRVHIDYADHLARCEMILSKPPGYWRSHPVLQLVAQGEGQRIEFKETLAVDARDGSPKDAEKTGTLKEVAGFLNAEGGSLLIGVSNAGEIKGIASDLPHCNRQNTDGFEQKIRELIAAKLQPAPVGTITVSFPVLPEGTVCQIDVPRSATVIHLENQVFLRDGNTTRSLTGPNLTAWITARQ